VSPALKPALFAVALETVALPLLSSISTVPLAGVPIETCQFDLARPVSTGVL
jgi:hypothetical protein